VVRDRRTAYYLMGGGDPQLRTSGAGSLLLWEAIRQTRTAVSVFDFEGSMLRPVERFFRAFGGRQSPYLRISRTTPTGRAALAIREHALRRVRDCGFPKLAHVTRRSASPELRASPAAPSSIRAVANRRSS
jgi:hypothetical protein